MALKLWKGMVGMNLILWF